MRGNSLCPKYRLLATETCSTTAQVPGHGGRFLDRLDNFKGDKINMFRILLLNVCLNDSI